MKPKIILRLIALLCIVTSAAAFTAPWFYKNQCSCATDGVNDAFNTGQAPKQEVMIWRSLYQHLLAFN